MKGSAQQAPDISSPTMLNRSHSFSFLGGVVTAQGRKSEENVPQNTYHRILVHHFDAVSKPHQDIVDALMSEARLAVPAVLNYLHFHPSTRLACLYFGKNVGPDGVARGVCSESGESVAQQLKQRFVRFTVHEIWPPLRTDAPMHGGPEAEVLSKMQVLVYVKRVRDAPTDNMCYVKCILQHPEKLHFDVVEGAQEKFRWVHRKLHIRMLDGLETQRAIFSYNEYDSAFRRACEFSIKHEERLVVPASTPGGRGREGRTVKLRTAKDRSVKLFTRFERPEGSTLDYKSYYYRPLAEIEQKAVKFMCGFLNAYGSGKLVVGVHELETHSYFGGGSFSGSSSGHPSRNRGGGGAAVTAGATLAVDCDNDSLPSEVLASFSSTKQIEQIAIGVAVRQEEWEPLCHSLTQQLQECVPPIPPELVQIDRIPLERPVQSKDSTWIVLVYDATPNWKQTFRQQSNHILRVLYAHSISLCPLHDVPPQVMESLEKCVSLDPGLCNAAAFALLFPEAEDDSAQIQAVNTSIASSGSNDGRHQYCDPELVSQVRRDPACEPQRTSSALPSVGSFASSRSVDNATDRTASPTIPQLDDSTTTETMFPRVPDVPGEQQPQAPQQEQGPLWQKELIHDMKRMRKKRGGSVLLRISANGNDSVCYDAAGNIVSSGRGCSAPSMPCEVSQSEGLVPCSRSSSSSVAKTQNTQNTSGQLQLPDLFLIEVSVNINRDKFLAKNYGGIQNMFFNGWPSIPTWQPSTKSIGRVERDYAVGCYRRIYQPTNCCWHTTQSIISVVCSFVIFSPTLQDIAMGLVPSEGSGSGPLGVTFSEMSNLYLPTSAGAAMGSTPPPVTPGGLGSDAAFSRSPPRHLAVNPVGPAGAAVPATPGTSPALGPQPNPFVVQDLQTTPGTLRLVSRAFNTEVCSMYGLQDIDSFVGRGFKVPFETIAAVQASLRVHRMAMLPLLLCWWYELVGVAPSPFPYLHVPLLMQETRTQSHLIPILYIVEPTLSASCIASSLGTTPVGGHLQPPGQQAAVALNNNTRDVYPSLQNTTKLSHYLVLDTHSGLLSVAPDAGGAPGTVAGGLQPLNSVRLVPYRPSDSLLMFSLEYEPGSYALWSLHSYLSWLINVKEDTGFKRKHVQHGRAFTVVFPNKRLGLCVGHGGSAAEDVDPAKCIAHSIEEKWN